MGATIHMHIETKLGDNWFHYSAPSIFRDRDFFEIVAGIYEGQPMIVPRGLPEKLSFETQRSFDLDSKRFKPHHIGWLSSKELVELQKRLIEIGEEQGKNSLECDLEEEYFHTYICGNSIACHKGWDDSRFIFWFDN